MLRTILFLFIFLCLASCQVKEGSSGLVSGHIPTTNKFTLESPVTKTYVSSETLTLKVDFPFDMTIDTTGGSPRLSLTVGATTRYATYAAQSDPRKLVFNYTFVPGENDTDGIVLNALQLNGSTLKFDQAGVLTNCDVSTIIAQTLTQLKVDTTSPTITAFSLLNLPGLYNEGEVLTFRMTFSENVVVTGTPKFVVAFDTGGSVDVNYSSGSGSNILIFTYTVGPTVSDINGFNSITSPIVNGTIQDVVGNNSSLNFSAFTAAVRTYTIGPPGVHISGALPFVVDTAFPANGTYIAAQDLDFTLEFDQPVTVSGLPLLTLDVNGSPRQAQYVSGSGSELITFRYTTVPGDVDPNGISVTGSINANAGDIVITAQPTISFFTDLNNSFTVPNTSGIILNALQPQATAVARNIDTTIPIWGGPAVDNTWMIGQDLNITVSFNTAMYVTQTAGTPSIPITIGSTTRQAVYLSGGNGQTSLVFRYVIVEGDLDADGTIAIGNISLNGGVIVDGSNTNTLLTLPSAGLLTTKVDGVKPVISTVTAPTNATYSEIAPFNESTMSFVVNWSEAVNYSATDTDAAYLSMDVGGSTVKLQWAVNNNVAAITHRPAGTTLNGTNDSNGVALSSPMTGTAIIKDQAGNTAAVFTYTPPTTTGILVDTTSPTVTSVTAITANGTYKAGEDLDFSVTFSESVTTVKDTTHPRIQMTVGASTKLLVATASTTATTHTFRYTIVANDLDTDGIVLSNAVQSNGTTAYARDGGRNNVTGTFGPPTTTGIKVDAVVPAAPTATGPTAKAYVSGETLSISVTYAEAITVDTTSGTPTIGIDFTVGTDNLTYASGSGTTTLVFSRLLTGTHFDMDGLPVSVTGITLNGGTLQDAGRNTAPVTFASAIDLSSTYVTYSEVKIWVKSNFVNLAPPTAAATIANGGAITTRTCSTRGICRIFDNDDSLYISSSLTNVSVVLMSIETPAVKNTDEDIFWTDIYLWAKAFNYDIGSQPATVTVDTTTYGTNATTHNANLALGTTHVMQVIYQTPQSYSAKFLLNNSFHGAIGEIIVIDGNLTPTTKLDNIRNYLIGRY
jgi:hypothetical protein